MEVRGIRGGNRNNGAGHAAEGKSTFAAQLWGTGLSKKLNPKNCLFPAGSENFDPPQAEATHGPSFTATLRTGRSGRGSPAFSPAEEACPDTVCWQPLEKRPRVGHPGLQGGLNFLGFRYQLPGNSTRTKFPRGKEGEGGRETTYVKDPEAKMTADLEDHGEKGTTHC